MILHHPFIISARLMPAIRIGDMVMSLDPNLGCIGANHFAHFYMDFADGTEYSDKNLKSGYGGFHSYVEPFESMLAFMEAAAEAMTYPMSDNRDLFPPHIMQWCLDNQSELECARCDLQVEDGNGEVNHDLIG